MLLARTAGQMVSLILLLFVLERYGSSVLAGATTFLSVAPGLAISPLAGTLLDRHGRSRLIVLDYLVAAVALACIAGLSLAASLPIPLFLAIVTAGSVTQPLSNIGMRTLFPLVVPRPLWERANAIDSNGYVVSGIFAPAFAGALVGAVHGEGALVVTAAIFGTAAAVSRGLRDPETNVVRGDSLVRDALAGVRYFARHATLRGLALSVSTFNIAWGLFFIAIPVLLVQRLGQSPAVVGQLFALSGIAGFFSVLLFGRMGVAGRERRLLAASMAAWAVAIVVVLLRGDVVAVALAMVIGGIATGPFDIALFTLRQRRTDPAWLGRAFAVSMALNFAGFPIGSALGGALAENSTALALTFALIVSAGSALLTLAVLPREE